MTYRVGIIGTGFGAKVHAPILQAHPKFDVVSLSSVHRSNANETAQQLSVPHAYSNWRDMLQSQDLDVVVVASNPALHKEMTLAALSHGRHVLCEKPPALNLSEAKAMAWAANQSNLTTAMNFEWRFLPERQEIFRLVTSGAIGQLLHVNWRECFAMWPTLANRPSSWLWKSSFGGGFFGAIGSHMIDSLHYWFGPLSWVQGRTETHVFARQSEQGLDANDADDSFYFHGDFTRGGSCSVQFTVAASGTSPSLEIFGTEGSIVFNGSELTLTTKDAPTPATITLEKRMDAGQFPEAIRGYIHAQWKLYDEFALTLSGNPSQDLPTFLDACHVQSVMDGVRHSNVHHRTPVEGGRR